MSGQRRQAQERHPGGRQLSAQLADHGHLIAEQVLQGHLVEDVPHPLLQRLPQAAQRAAGLVDAGAFGLQPGVAFTIAGLVVERLAQREQDAAQADLLSAVEEGCTGPALRVGGALVRLPRL